MKNREFEEMIRAKNLERTRRLAVIRSTLTPRGGTWTGRNDETYHAHPNTHESRDKYPWQLTLLRCVEGAIVPVPFSHTEHEALDLDDDHGPYYHSITHELLSSSVAIPTEKSL